MRAYSSGCVSLSHRILGPTDCEVRALPQVARMAASPMLFVEPVDLGRGARVDAVEHAVHQRLTGRVDRQHAGADGAGRDSIDGAGVEAETDQKLARDGHEVAPPVLPGSMLGPAGSRHQHLVRSRGAGRDDVALDIGQDALRLERADVDAERVAHGARINSQVRSRCGRAPRRAATRAPAMSSGSTTSRAECE